MDRTSFLCCLSFLYPLSSSSIQDSDLLSPLISGTAKCRHEVLLADMGLSIEPCENAIAYNDNNNDDNNKGINRTIVTKRSSSSSSRKRQSIGPAYFLPKNTMTARKILNSTNHNANEADDDTNNKGDGDGDGTNDDVDGGDKSVVNPVTDPTFCKIELTLHTAKLPEKGMTTPVKKSNKRNPSEIDDQVVAKNEAILIANIDGK